MGGRLRPLPYKTIAEILLHNSFKFISQESSHAKFKKEGIDRPVIVVCHPGQDVAKGTISNIIRTSKKSREEFVNV